MIEFQNVHKTYRVAGKDIPALHPTSLAIENGQVRLERPATPESTARAKELKRRGFVFVGPTTAYALMQATGMVDDHVADCFRAGTGG